MNIVTRGLLQVWGMISRGFLGGGTGGKNYIVCSSTDPDGVDFYVNNIKVGRFTSA